MTCRSYYSRISVHRYISLFFIIMFLLARLFFVANSPLNAVFIFTLPCLSIVSFTRSSTASPVFQKPSLLDVIRVYHRVERFSNAVSISRHRCLAPMNRSHTEFKFSSLAIHVITDCLLPIDNHRRLA